MITYIALLRGINVGGRNRLAMASLRTLLEDLGHGEPRTHLQSGNILFTSERTDAAALERELAARIAEDLGVAPAVLLRTAGELSAVVAGNPFGEAAAADPTTVHAAFLSAQPADAETFAVSPEAHAPDEMAVGDRVLYLHLPGGLGRSRLVAELERRRGGIAMTIRNWRTVTRLHELAGG